MIGLLLSVDPQRSTLRYGVDLLAAEVVGYGTVVGVCQRFRARHVLDKALRAEAAERRTVAAEARLGQRAEGGEACRWGLGGRGLGARGPGEGVGRPRRAACGDGIGCLGRALGRPEGERAGEAPAARRGAGAAGGVDILITSLAGVIVSTQGALIIVPGYCLLGPLLQSPSKPFKR